MMFLNRRRVSFETMFNDLQPSLDAIYQCTEPQLISGVHMIQAIYDMCTARPRSYTLPLFTALAYYIEERAHHSLMEIVNSDHPLQTYGQQWSQYSVASQYLDAMCGYLNKRLKKITDASNSTSAPHTLQPILDPSSSTTTYHVGISPSPNPVNENNFSPEPGSVYATYGDRSMVVGRRTYYITDILTLACFAWRVHVLDTIRDGWENLLINHTFEIVTRVRKGVTADYSLVRNFVESLCVIDPLGVASQSWYVVEFKTPYLVRLAHYCQKRSQELFETLDITAFMEQTISLLNQEVANGERFCHPSTLPDIVSACERSLLGPFATQLRTVFTAAITAECHHQCALAYTLLSRMPTEIEPVVTVYEQYVAECGRELRRECSTTDFPALRALVNRLITLHEKHTHVVQTTFQGDQAFFDALDKAFHAIVNEYRHGTTMSPNSGSPASSSSGSSGVKVAKPFYAPELLARYCDCAILRRPVRAVLQTKELVQKINQVTNLFKYIDDKDIFQKIYARLLARRLIFGQSASVDTEAMVISRLKSICGIEYISKLQQMLTDVTTSEALSDAYQRQAATGSTMTNPKDEVPIRVMMLTARAWPMDGQQHPTFRLPAVLTTSLHGITEYYHSQHSGRRIQWLWPYSRAVVKLRYLDKRYEVNLSLFQLAVLLQFETVDRCTVSGLLEATKLSWQELKHALYGLTTVGLLKGPQTSTEISKTTVVHLNSQYSSRRHKIKVPMAFLPDNTAEVETATKTIKEDRQLYLQSVIVRIMKTRKRLTHAELVQDVTQAAKSRFQPSVSLIKKCIEHLLSKEYIERGTHNRDVYLYIV
ncbi:hypothetical protein IWQ61_000232 [Dispira simplex]|nr:hypothetical protein IWQ61_000232 [Dispira simplex]